MVIVLLISPQISQIIPGDAEVSSPENESNLQIWNRLDARITLECNNSKYFIRLR